METKGLNRIVDLSDVDPEAFAKAKKRIEKSIKERPKGVIRVDQKEIDLDARRVMFAISPGDSARRQTALSFDTILALADQIKKEEAKRA